MNQIAALDEKVLLWIYGFAGRCSLFDSLMRLVVNDYFVPASIALILIGLWFWGKNMSEREVYQRAVMAAWSSLGISCGVVAAINVHYNRLRPFENMDILTPTVERLFCCPIDSSFPSMPAAITFATAVTMWLSHRKIVAGLLCFLALMMSFARVYVGAHYPLDIVGGAVIAIFVSYIVVKVIFPLLEPVLMQTLKILRKLCIA